MVPRVALNLIEDFEKGYGFYRIINFGGIVDAKAYGKLISQHDDFYPFGLQMPGRSNNSANRDDDQKFTGHFLEPACRAQSGRQDDDLDIYHAQARMYDPAIGRFLGVDAMRELYPSFGSYTYVMNNPTLLIDPTGNCAAINDAAAGLYEGDDARDLAAQCYEGQDPPEVDSSKNLNSALDEIGEINNILAGAGASSTGIKNFWNHFVENSHANVKDAALEAGLPTDKIDEIMNRHSNFAKAARLSGYFFFAIEALIGVNDFRKNPTPLNAFSTASDISIAAYAAFGPHGIKVLIVYHGGKQSYKLMIDGLEQGIIRPNPNPTRGLTPSLAPTHLIPNY